MNAKQHPQLSMQVLQHAELEGPEEDAYMAGSVKVAGDFSVDRDLNAGEEFTVTIHSADGEVIAQGVCKAKAPKFGVIMMDKRPIGMERLHTIKVQQ
jgi:hypothetical protein